MAFRLADFNLCIDDLCRSESGVTAMAFCPVDYKPCIDDICYGSGCLRYPCRGDSMLVKCPGGCDKLVAMDGSWDDECECEPDEDDHNEE